MNTITSDQPTIDRSFWQALKVVVYTTLVLAGGILAWLVYCAAAMLAGFGLLWLILQTLTVIGRLF